MQDEFPSDKSLDYGKELWSTGNIIAGFCIVQTIAFLEEAGKRCSPLGVSVAEHGYNAMAGVGVFLFAELGLILLCHAGHLRILRVYSIPVDLQRVFRSAVYIRSGIVVFSLLVSFWFIADSAWTEQRASESNLRSCGFLKVDGPHN